MLFVKPAFEEFCSPTKKYADVIIPRGADNIGKFEKNLKSFKRRRDVLSLSCLFFFIKIILASEELSLVSANINEKFTSLATRL